MVERDGALFETSKSFSGDETSLFGEITFHGYRMVRGVTFSNPQDLDLPSHLSLAPESAPPITSDESSESIDTLHKEREAECFLRSSLFQVCSNGRHAPRYFL